MTCNFRGRGIRWKIPDFLSDGNSNVYISSVYLSKLSLEKCYLENLGQGKEFNICTGPIRWEISTSKKVILEHFSLALTVIEMFALQNLWLGNLYLGRDLTTFAVASFDGKCLISYLTATARFRVCSVRVCARPITTGRARLLSRLYIFCARFWQIYYQIWT